MEIKDSIAVRLRVAMASNGVSARELAAKTGICPNWQELLPTARAGVRSALNTLSDAFA